MSIRGAWVLEATDKCLSYVLGLLCLVPVRLSPKPSRSTDFGGVFPGVLFTPRATWPENYWLRQNIEASQIGKGLLTMAKETHSKLPVAAFSCMSGFLSFIVLKLICCCLSFVWRCLFFVAAARPPSSPAPVSPRTPTSGVCKSLSISQLDLIIIN